MTVEKKRQTLKTTVRAQSDKFMVFLGRPCSGHNHDYLLLTQEFPPEWEWFADMNVRVDLGYLGIRSDYRGDRIDLPTKKPRKRQKHPNPQLSDEQKAANTALSRVRIFIEHAIGGMKRSNILVHTFRNRLEHFEDDVIGICAGLWNLVLSY
jgi:DDE superfamily endonuclease